MTIHSGGGFDFLVKVLVEGAARGVFQNRIEQGIRSVVVGPTGARNGQVGEAGIVGAIEVGHPIVQAAGHGQLVADVNSFFLGGGQAAPAGAQISGGGIGDAEQVFLLGDTYKGGGYGFAGRGPTPHGGGGLPRKVLFKDDFAVLEQDKGLGIVAIQEGVKAVNSGLAPTQGGRRHGIPDR